MIDTLILVAALTRPITPPVPARPILVVKSEPEPPKTDTCHLHRDTCWEE